MTVWIIEHCYDSWESKYEIHSVYLDRAKAQAVCDDLNKERNWSPYSVSCWYVTQ